MKNRVYNSTFGKIGRTLGFLLILFSSVVIATNLIILNQAYEGISALLPIAQQVSDILDSLPAVLGEYISIMFFVGFIFVIWAIRRGFVLRILLTVLLVFMLGFTLFSFTGPLTPVLLAFPEFLTDVLVQLVDLYAKINDISEYIFHGIALAIPLLLWYVFANKKPGRLSLFVLRVGATFLFLAVAMLGVATEFATSMLTNDLYVQVMQSLYTLSFLLFVAGSAFGVVGFMKK
jgi:hypothetical protein